MGFKETRTYLEKCISRSVIVALSAPPPGVINCVCVCVCVDGSCKSAPDGVDASSMLKHAACDDKGTYSPLKRSFKRTLIVEGHPVQISVRGAAPN
jgi:hypothetical protein